MMASSAPSSSSSSRHTIGTPPYYCSQTAAKQEKKFPNVDDYRYLAAGLIKQQPKSVKPNLYRLVDSNTMNINRIEQTKFEKKPNKPKSNVELITMKNLAKEMSKMLANAKSKGQTNELLQLFKNTLNNFVIDKQHHTDCSREVHDFNVDIKKSVKKMPPKLNNSKQDKVPVIGCTCSSGLPDYPSLSNTNRLKKDAPSSSEFTVLSDREKSIITTTTVTRTKIREPIVSMLESSKMNVLHRCYGKQSVKALPLAYKSIKKPKTNHSQPQLMKPKSVIKSTKPQQPNANHLMKTVYENEQFDKSKPINSSYNNKMKKKKATFSLIESDTETQKTEVLNEEKKTNSLQSIHTIPYTEEVEMESKHNVSIADTNTDKNSSCHNIIELEKGHSDPDNSLVQRLTSFWNKKLNTSGNEKSNTSSDHSSLGSGSINTYTINSCSDTHIGNKENVNSLGKNSNSNVCNLSDKDNDRKVSCASINGSVDQRDGCTEDKSDIPDIKLGLMDELIKVLKGANGFATKGAPKTDTNSTTKEDFNESKQKNDSQLSETKIHTPTEDLGKKESTSNFSVASNYKSDESTDDEFSIEGNMSAHNLIDNNQDDDRNHHPDNDGDDSNEETIEAIETCLMRRITVRNINVNEFKGSTREIADEYREMDKNYNNGAEISSLDVCEHIEEYNTEHIVEEHDRARGCNELIPLDEKCMDQHLFSNPSEDTITATLMNVNDIIINLRSLICEIETIPEDLKRLNLDVNILPIPDKIKQTLYLIIKDQASQDYSSNHSNDNSCDVTNSQSFYSTDDKKFESCTRKGTSFTCYFPSTYTVPILVNVSNPVQMVMFPNRKTKDLKSGGSYYIYDADDYLTFKNEGKRSENTLCHSTSQDSAVNTNKENYTCLARVMTTTHLPNFTVFCGTMSSNKMISPKGNATSIFCPNKKKAVILKQDFTDVFNENNQVSISKNNSLINLKHTVSADSYNLVSESNDKNGGDNFCRNCDGRMTENNCIVSRQGNATSFLDVNSTNEMIFSRNQNIHCTGNNYRRRKLWRQPNTEDDISIGGSGDYGGGLTPFPCQRTSSMSVIFSSSINDSNSQSDIHITDNEYRMRSLVGVQKPQSESDNISRCVIQETCEEHMSDIDDCVMVDQHRKHEIERSRTTDEPHLLLDVIPKAVKDCRNDNLFSQNFNTPCNQNLLSDENFQTDQATSTTDLKPIKNALLQNNSATVNYFEKSKSDNIGTVENKDNKKQVLFRKMTRSEMMRKVLKQKAISSKYNLDILFNRDPNLKKELANIIDLDHLCDKEKQLIAICLMLLRRNYSLSEKPLIKILLDSAKESATNLCNKMSRKFSRKISGAKERLIIKYQSQTKLLICCQYKHLIKIVYTTLISLMLCFIIQKHFCGISLPICFPW